MADIDNLEERLRRLEQWRARLGGAVALGSILALGYAGYTNWIQIPKAAAEAAKEAANEKATDIVDNDLPRMVNSSVATWIRDNQPALLTKIKDFETQAASYTAKAEEQSKLSIAAASKANAEATSAARAAEVLRLKVDEAGSLIQGILAQKEDVAPEFRSYLLLLRDNKMTEVAMTPTTILGFDIGNAHSERDQLGIDEISITDVVTGEILHNRSALALQQTLRIPESSPRWEVLMLFVADVQGTGDDFVGFEIRSL